MRRRRSDRPTDDRSSLAWRGRVSDAVDDEVIDEVMPERTDTPTTADGTEAMASDVSRAAAAALLRDLVGPHRRSIVWAAVLIAVSVIGDLAGPMLVGRAIDHGIPPLLPSGDGTVVPLAQAVGAYLVFSLLSHLAYTRFVLLSGRVGESILFTLRTRVFDHTQRLSLSFHERFTSGRVISRLTSDIEALSELLGQGLTSLLNSGLILVGIGVTLFIMKPTLALVSVASFPVVIWITRWFRRHSEAAYRESRNAVAGVIVHFTETLGGLRAVQAYRREPRNQELFEALDDRYRTANVWSSDLAGTFGPALQALGRVSTLVVLVVGGWWVADGSLTVGTLASFLLYLRRFFEPLQDLSQFTNLFQSASAALEKLAALLATAPTVAEPHADDAVHLPAPTPGGIRFEGVSFAYRHDVVLHPLDLEIPAGQTVALVGPTGAGKTTVARLVARFWDPTEGRILLDGVDLRDLNDERLRAAVAMVTQENVLFTGTIADNIAFGRPDASRQEVEAAAAAIGADVFIDALPHGFDTQVRRRGGRLSAGQRQLVAFARAFLADPSVLILDEATSSLDIPSERAVQRALRTLLAERSALIIAHRLTTVEIADRVLVIDDGRIVEDGTPDQLLSSGGRYAALDEAWTASLA